MEKYYIKLVFGKFMEYTENEQLICWKAVCNSKVQLDLHITVLLTTITVPSVFNQYN